MSGDGAEDRLTLRAHAKVNLGLAVLARRGDAYHEVETLLVRVSLHDDLEVGRTAAAGVRLEATGLPVPTGETNLAVRAAAAYANAAGLRGGVSLRLTKRIPVAAGLGGGSSDAAAVLRALARLAPGAVDLRALGATLGSDVPFFVEDVTCALARGRGERLQAPPRRLPQLHMVLLDPGVPISAAEAYARLQSFTRRLHADEALSALATGGDGALVNGLQAGVVAVHPEVREALMELRGQGLRNVLMSGSGSTCFGLADSAEAARTAASELRLRRPGWRAEAVRSV